MKMNKSCGQKMMFKLFEKLVSLLDTERDRGLTAEERWDMHPQQTKDGDDVVFVSFISSHHPTNSKYLNSKYIVD